MFLSSDVKIWARRELTEELPMLFINILTMSGFFALLKKITKFDIFKTTGKLKISEAKKYHYFVDLDERILKMYTVWGFQAIWSSCQLQFALVVKK